jgi:hypothetical protein
MIAESSIVKREVRGLWRRNVNPRGDQESTTLSRYSTRHSGTPAGVSLKSTATVKPGDVTCVEEKAWQRREEAQTRKLRAVLHMGDLQKILGRE